MENRELISQLSYGMFANSEMLMFFNQYWGKLIWLKYS